MLVKVLLTFFIALASVDAHGNIVNPFSWLDHKVWMRTAKGIVYDYVGMKSGLQCAIGCDLDGTKLCPSLEYGCPYPGPGCACNWYSNWTFIATPTLNDPKFRTYNYVSHPEYFQHNPWRAPGSAIIQSPCGVAGGNHKGCIHGNCSTDQGGYGFGIKATDFQFPYKFYETTWKTGEVVEVAWSIAANHGGGYSYRLCKIPDDGISALTEDICQKIPLKFSGDMQWAQYGEDPSTRVSFKAVRVSTGTNPPGSQWTKNPIPACRGDDGGFLSPTRECLLGTQFQPPRPDLYGFGVNIANSYNFKFSIIDKLEIPKEITPGKYVLSFRWDCEQTPQVWNTCASINLV